MSRITLSCVFLVSFLLSEQLSQLVNLTEDKKTWGCMFKTQFFLKSTISWLTSCLPLSETNSSGTPCRANTDFSPVITC